MKGDGLNMRLIDADKLMQDVKINAERWAVIRNKTVESIIDKVLYIIEHTETVDAVPVVRCKDCKHAKRSSYVTERYGVPGVKTCKRLRRCVGPDDFCWQGEQKDDDE